MTGTDSQASPAVTTMSSMFGMGVFFIFLKECLVLVDFPAGLKSIGWW